MCALVTGVQTFALPICSTLVALAIGAVTPGWAMAQASAISAGLAPVWAANASSAASNRMPRGFRYFSTRVPRALLPRSSAERPEERRVGKEWVSRRRYRWVPENEKKKEGKKETN